MAAPDNRSAKDQDRHIVRLLRFLGNAQCRAEFLDTGNDAIYRLERSDGTRVDMPAGVVSAAKARGLVALNLPYVAATAESRAFLRRHMAAREEAFLDQHRSVEIHAIVAETEVTHVRVNAAESPLAVLSRLKDRAGKEWFSADAISAGERLARDFQYAALQPRLTQTYAPRIATPRGGVPGAGVEMNDTVMAARLRVTRAVEAMGPELSGVALDICCFEKGLETVERERQWPARSAKLMLRAALSRLHRHYQPPARRRQHAWGDEGYRPDLQT